MKTLRVLFVASELTPVAKVGGLGDVMDGLPKALRSEGVLTAVIIPLYKHLLPLKKRWKRVVANEKISVFGKVERVSVYAARTKAGEPAVFFMDNRNYLGSGGIYFSKTGFVSHEKELRRFVFFSEAVFRLLERGSLPFAPDIVHGNDWHTARLIELLAASKLKIKTVFSIHNLANQGTWRGKNLMREGIGAADSVGTVSPTYAQEITTKEFGAGLDGVLRKRKDLWDFERREL